MTNDDLGGRETSLSALAALNEPLRGRIYRYVAAQEAPVGRDQVATALGIARSVAAFHLDKLARAALLAVEFRRPPGRRGPGAGRPAKLYRRAKAEVSVSVPERHYDLLGRLLADAVAMASDLGMDPTAAARTVAHAHGRELGQETRPSEELRSATRLDQIADVLRAQGYEPRVEDGTVWLDNCPFHAIADQQRDLVCGMNHALVDGLLEGMELPTFETRLKPAPGRCCVSVHLGPTRGRKASDSPPRRDRHP